jgi:hypothetical protein
MCLRKQDFWWLPSIVEEQAGLAVTAMLLLKLK